VPDIFWYDYSGYNEVSLRRLVRRWRGTRFI